MRGSSVRARRLRFSLFVILALLYLLFFGVSAQARGWFDYIGVDYRVYWASAQIARTYGFADVYDLNRQTEFQDRVYRQYARAAQTKPVEVIEIPYLPIFIAPLLPFGLLDPMTGFVLWSAANGLFYLAYVWRLMRASRTRFDAFLGIGVFLSLPFMFNLFFGQIDIILFVALGEALIALGRDKEATAGAWLAGLLLKPQLLVLILPGLLIQKKWRALAGFGAVALLLIVASVVLAGVDGMLAWTRLVLNFAAPQGVATNFTESMMSWRALALNWDSVAPLKIGWGLALVGIGITAFAGLSLWFYARASEKYLWVWLGTLAATFAVAWHSHVHTAVLLFAPMILGWQEFRSLRVLRWWLVLPAAAFLGVVWIYTPLILAFDSAASLVGPAFAHIVVGAILLVLNLMILYQTWQHLRQSKEQARHAVQ